MARKLILLIALFVAFYLAAHLYIRRRNTVTDDVTKIFRLVECQPNDVKSLTIQQNNEGKAQEIHFERLDKPEPGIPAVTAVSRWEWKLASPPGGEADPVLVRRIASTICELYEPIPVRDEFFGLKSATRRLARKVTAALSGENTDRYISFEFGAMNDRSTVVHFDDGAHGVRAYKIPDRFLQVTSLPPEEFRNLRVMRLDADNVQQATLTVDGKERFTLERAGADWKVLLGGKEKGDGAEEAGRFLNRISTLRALEVLDVAYGPKACESAKAKAVLRVHGIAGREETLRFDYGRGGDISACSSLGTQKFRVHRDLLKYLDIPLRNVLAK
jgi:hypothetical protein